MRKILAMSGGSYIGGVEVVTLQVLNGLKAKGHSIFCLTNGWNDGDFHQRLKASNIPYRAIKLGWFYIRKPWWTIDTILHLPMALLKGRSALRSIPHDVIYATSYRQLLMLYPFIEKPILLHVHDPLDRDRNSKWIIRFLKKKITAYIAVSDFIKRDLVKGGVAENNVHVVHNGVVIPAKPDFHRENKGEKITLGIAGQIIPRKGHEDAIEALKTLVDKGYTNLQLYIVGKGDPLFTERLKKMIEAYQLKPYIVWRGFQQSLSEIYQGIDVLLAPTRSPEPFGMIAIEANAMGIPVIVSDQGGLPEIVTDGQNGLIVPASDPIALEKAISLYLENPTLINKHGEQGRSLVNRKFSAKKMLSELDQIIES